VCDLLARIHVYWMYIYICINIYIYIDPLRHLSQGSRSHYNNISSSSLIIITIIITTHQTLTQKQQPCTILAQGLLDRRASNPFCYGMDFEVNFGVLGALGALLAFTIITLFITLFTCGCQCAYRTPTSPQVRIINKDWSPLKLSDGVTVSVPSRRRRG